MFRNSFLQDTEFVAQMSTLLAGPWSNTYLSNPSKLRKSEQDEFKKKFIR